MSNAQETQLSSSFSKLKISEPVNSSTQETKLSTYFSELKISEPVNSFDLATVRLLEKLKNLPPPLNNMVQFLQRYQGVMTGSFLLSCLFPELKPNDIDVVFGGNWIWANNALFDMGWNYGGTDNLTNYCNLGHITTQYYLKHKLYPELKLNFIVYEKCQTQNDIRQCIKEYFDFDGCTLNWDGKAWHIVEGIDMKNFLTHKVMKYRESQLNHRLQKPEYLPPKFICNDVPWEVAIHNWIADRLKKYEARGFTISNGEYVRKELAKMLKNESSDLAKKQRLTTMMDEA
jgi:hypothetical protein